MGSLLTMIGMKSLLAMLLEWLTGELKELWQDGTIKGLAKDAVEYAQATYNDNDEKRDAAIARMVETAKDAGKEVSEEAALMLVEKAVQRFLK